MMYQQSLLTPLGELAVRASESGITQIQFLVTTDIERSGNAEHGNAITALAIEQLSEYFAGERHIFALPLAPQGTEFQHKIWTALQTIEFGVSCSYGDIAKHIHQPTAARAVGMANSKNPIAIVIPCHRVIGKNGTLTGYAGGLDKKSWLLQHEQAAFKLVG
jgi:methylated-DNA-[protein]-cysteine S-methyltransferase